VPRLAALVAACLLTSLLALPVGASTSTTITTDITVGASHTYPSGAWGFSDGCETGISAGQEYRCAFEFDISALPSTAKVTSAVLSIRRSGGCATNDCPVDLYAYTGNGSAGLGDVTSGSSIATWTPTSTTTHQWNVLGHIQAHASAGDDWAGFRLSWSSGNSAIQDFDISSGSRVSLAISYVAHPVDVQVYLSGAGEGANGSVTSNPGGIDCGTACLATFEYAEPVTLTAEPANGATFGSWLGGPCGGSTNPVCSFEVPALNVETTASFYGITPPVSQPPGPTPHPTATSATPSSPRPSTHPTTVPGRSGDPTAGPSGTVAPAGATAAATELPTTAPGASQSPDVVTSPSAIGTPSAPVAASGDSPLILIVVIAALIVAVGGGSYWLGQRRRAAPPPGG